ncbi:MAG: hypothetical protein K8T20_13675 [Planctomycetes bacterium]|nr:hypothetical protein [Planctomycetota bacterium]
MLRGILVGLMVGALATACVLKAMASHKAEAVPVAAAPAMAAQDPAALKAEADGLRTGNALLQKDIEGKKAELASLEKQGSGGDGTKNGKKTGGKSWKELAPSLSKGFGSRGEGEERDDKAAQAAMLDFYGMVARIAKQRGIAMDDAMSTPEGLPLLLKALLETGEPPATAEQLAQMDALIASYTTDWDKVHDPAGNTSKLEQRLATGELADGYVENFTGLMSQAQKDANKNYEMFTMMGGGMGGGSHWSNGTRETVIADMTADWAKSIKLDDAQKMQIGPFVEQYMKEYAEVTAKYQGGPEGGSRETWKTMQRERVQAQIKAQQAIASAMSLTPAQAKALSAWATTYDFSIQDAPTGPDGVPVPIPPEK